MNGPNEHRINARVDEATQKQLDELVLSTGQTISHVVREAIAVYHVQVRQQQRPLPRKLLAMVGRGRSKDGRTDVSENYKDIVTEAIEEKYALSHPRSPPPVRKNKR